MNHLEQAFNIDWYNTSDRILFTVYMHFLWGALFYASIKFINFKGLDEKLSVSIKQKFVALIHDVLVVAVPLWSYAVRGFHLKGEAEPELLAVLLSAGAYFTVHLYVISSFKITNNSQVFHHVWTVIAIYVSVFVPGFAAGGAFYLFIFQLSHIPLHGRAILREFGMRYTNLYECAELFYFAVYMFERLVLGTFGNYYAIWELGASFGVYAFTGGLWLQSLYFCYQMVILTYKKYLKYKERSQKNIHYWWVETNPMVEKLSYYKREEKEKIF